MESIRMIIKSCYGLVIMAACVLWVISVCFSDFALGEMKLFETSGDIFRPMLGSDELKSEGLNYIEDSVSGYISNVSYTAGAKTMGEYIIFKDMFTVSKENGTMAGGSTEDGFSIYLMDIRNKAGNSVLECLTTAEITTLEEIPSAFIYDTERDTLYFFESGVYTMYVKIYDDGGGTELYEFQLPVESA